MPSKEKRLKKNDNKKSRLVQIFTSEKKSEDLLELHALNIGLLHITDNEYIDSKGNRYAKTPLGFKRESEQNLKTENYILNRKLHNQDQLTKQYQDDIEHMEQRRAKQQLHVLKSHQEIKELKKQIGQLNRHLKEALDRNISFQNKIVRLENNFQNLEAQIEKLKSAKLSLLEQNQNLTNKISKLK